MGRNKKSKIIPEPKFGGTSNLLPIETTVDYNARTPVFCFAHLKTGFAVKDLEKVLRAALASRLQDLSQLTWGEITRQPKHKHGTETLPVAMLRTSMPAKFGDEDRVLVLRYSDRLPMVGIRINDVFHVIAIEARYGELYDHGS